MTEPAEHVSSYPIRLAIVIGLAFAFVLVVGVAAIGGAYAIALHASNATRATEQEFQARAKTFQIRSAIPTCRALGKISADAQEILNLPSVKNASPQKKVQIRPVVQFFGDFPDVYRTSGCPSVIEYAKKHGIK